MTVAEATQKMILLSDANFHDINHFLKVHAYARQTRWRRSPRAWRELLR